LRFPSLSSSPPACSSASPASSKKPPGSSAAPVFRPSAESSSPSPYPGVAAAAIFAFVISWNEVFAASVLTVRHRTLTAFLLSVLSESPLQDRLAGNFLLIIPSVLFIFFVRRYLFSMWGIASR
jgi:hypothetical protein